MINEKKLIEEIENAGFFIAGVARGKGMIMRFLQDYKKAIIKCIDEQPKVGEWIPCIDRLPENNTNVIACFCTESVTELLYEGEGKFRGLYEYPKDVITAWMPLPAPYNAERGGKND